jgi:hypothetical protein
MPGRAVVLTVLLSALPAASTEAQMATRQSTLSMQLSWLHEQQQNAQVSPLRYAGTGSGPGVAYHTETDRWRAGLSVAYASAQLRSDISRDQEHTGDSRWLVLRIPYERRVSGAAASRSGLRLGAQLAGDLLYRDHSYSRMLSTEHFIDAFVWLGVLAGWQGQLVPGWRFQYHSALPVLGLVWRTPYTGAKYMPRAQITAPGTWLAFDHQVSLTHALSGAFDVRASYQLHLLRHDDTWDLASISNRMSIGLDWHLRRPVNLSARSPAGGAQ